MLMNLFSSSYMNVLGKTWILWSLQLLSFGGFSLREKNPGSRMQNPGRGHEEAMQEKAPETP